ncbi:MAG: hypothetical protein JWO78_678 [Micavibrio sp.]|nr:hypothetical protein [Micavibrio sp.]
MKKFLKLAVILFCALSLYSGSVKAQGTPPVKPASAGDTYIPPVDKDNKITHYATDDETVIDDGYAVPTYKNLSKLYWALAMFDLADNDAIDGFLIINQCDMFAKFFNSDFELESLREATRQSIQKNMIHFPMKFEIMIPVGLDRYNIGTEKFAIDPRSQFLGSRRLEVAVNSDFGAVCNSILNVNKYPRNFILSLSRPLTVTDVPVDPEVAQFHIEQQEKEAPTHGYRGMLSKYNRVAYLRLTVSMNQFKGYTKPDANSSPLAEVFATIDGFEMYGDRDKTLLMYNQKMEEERVAKRAKSRSVSVPQGQLIESKDVDAGGNVILMSSAKNTINKASPETGAEETMRFDMPSSQAPAAK